MSRGKHNGHKFPIMKGLSLGAIILGASVISFALVHIHGQSVPNTYGVGQSISAPRAPTQKNVLQLQSPVPTTQKLLYSVIPSVGSRIGSLTIPAIKLTLPIIQGTDAAQLSQGVGHFTESVLPGEDNNSVLSGHRDTVFWQLGSVKIGNRLIVQTSAGTFTYVIRNIRIVQKDDKTVIVPTDHAVLTLTTCYPFVFVGSAPERYIVTADLRQADEASVAVRPPNE